MLFEVSEVVLPREDRLEPDAVILIVIFLQSHCSIDWTQNLIAVIQRHQVHMVEAYF
jgi:hypothetical protein